MSKPTPKEKFYENGIRFKCKACGDCCTGAPGTVKVTESEIDAICEFLEMTRANFIRHCLRRIPGGYSINEKENWDCLFFKKKKCEIYSVRPMQCRTWPFWPRNLRSQKMWDEVCGDCKGIGRGRLYSKKEIEKLAEHSV